MRPENKLLQLPAKTFGGGGEEKEIEIPDVLEGPILDYCGPDVVQRGSSEVPFFTCYIVPVRAAPVSGILERWRRSSRCSDAEVNGRDGVGVTGWTKEKMH